MRIAGTLFLALAVVSGGCAAGTEARATKTLEEIEHDRTIETAASERLGDIPSHQAEAPSAPWEGVYYQGDGLGVNVSFGVSKRAGAAYLWRGCLGTYGGGVGTVKEAGDHLEVSLERQFGMGKWDNPQRFFPVTWGERHYLITEQDMNRFCADVKRSYEPREGMHGIYFLRRGDDKLPASGQPRVPEQFQGLLSSASK